MATLLMNKNLLAVFLGVLLLGVAQGDEVDFINGTKAYGTVAGKTGKILLLQEKNGTIGFPINMIALIRPGVDEPVIAERPNQIVQAKDQEVFPDFTSILKTLSAQTWGKSVRQIPATVVDVGPMKFVPYLSFQCNQDYELNIYGDPENPSGIEIGIYRDLLKRGEVKEACVKFMLDFLKTNEQKAALKAMNRTQDSVVVEGLRMDITPETADDAYGGWWISIYDQNLMEKNRATPQEIQQITEPKNLTDSMVKGTELLEWTPEDMQQAKPANSSAPPANSARPLTAPSSTPVVRNPGSEANSYSTPLPTSSGGTVYVKGYYRKDGTYVHSYTRRAPSKK